VLVRQDLLQHSGCLATGSPPRTQETPTRRGRQRRCRRRALNQRRSAASNAAHDPAPPRVPWPAIHGRVRLVPSSYRRRGGLAPHSTGRATMSCLVRPWRRTCGRGVHGRRGGRGRRRTRRGIRGIKSIGLQDIAGLGSVGRRRYPRWPGRRCAQGAESGNRC
jgi:hypothetical protein